MEAATGIEDTLEVLGELPAAPSRVVYQHLGIAHDGRRRRAQFLPYVGNEGPLRSAVGHLVSWISRGTISLFNGLTLLLSAQATLGKSKASILPSRRGHSTGLVS
jgi:hypothetical protein